eukprot:PLAT1615.1.p1 GENE.PLAT1615.1~~PLAT1615.1.p1  ORF type:complete len:405 (+),score=141.68 PLAT1615.1:1537-2751(+)
MTPSTAVRAAAMLANGAIVAIVVGAVILLLCVYQAVRRGTRPDHDTRPSKRLVPYDGQVDIVPPGEVGSLLFRDFRGGIEAEAEARAAGVDMQAAMREGELPDAPFVRVVSWNIERGYKVADLAAKLREVNADIVLLQEVDIDARRSGRIDTGAELAAALRMSYIFANQMDDIEEPAPPAREGAARGPGWEGNAVLTRLPIESAHALHLTCVRTTNTTPHRKLHTCPVVTVRTQLGPLTVTSVHLDPFCGIRGRLVQMGEIWDDHARRWPAGEPAIIGGDFNTGAHGVARCLPQYASDDLRWRTLGVSEATWWERHALPGRGWSDPWDKESDLTLSIFGGIFSAKLDWLLMTDGLHTVKKWIGGEQASDHQYVAADVQWERAGDGEAAADADEAGEGGEGKEEE